MTDSSSFLARLRAGRRRHGLAGFFRRELRRFLDRHLRPVRRSDLDRVFRELGIREGDTVCVHSAISKLGYVEGGPNALIDALEAAVGPSGTLLMPTFQTAGSMASLIDAGRPFDPRHDPSKVGLLTEVFRSRAHVVRSLHPTNSVAAWGANADAYVEGHERSPTPYGDETPYGRLARDPRGRVLMLETHVHSYLHHLQERIDFPNLFLPDAREAAYLDHAGNPGTTTTRVMRPRLTYFVAIAAHEGVDAWAILHDYCLLFPSRRLTEVRRLGYTFDPMPAIRSRAETFVRAGFFRIGRLGRGEVGCLDVGPYTETIEPELRATIDRFRDRYDVDALERSNLPYL